MVQDFLIKLGMKPPNHVIVRNIKTMNRAEKNWAHFQKTKYFKNQSFQKISIIKVDDLLV